MGGVNIKLLSPSLRGSSIHWVLFLCQQTPQYHLLHENSCMMAGKRKSTPNLSLWCSTIIVKFLCVGGSRQTHIVIKHQVPSTKYIKYSLLQLSISKSLLSPLRKDLKGFNQLLHTLCVHSYLSNICCYFYFFTERKVNHDIIMSCCYFFT